ncbi:hypothetical protein SNEBB_002459 [Seison nebaliae]|nr:hypothetical protein SNEBB_002459 [Seison nebaliae]
MPHKKQKKETKQLDISKPKKNEKSTIRVDIVRGSMANTRIKLRERYLWHEIYCNLLGRVQDVQYPTVAIFRKHWILKPIRTRTSGCQKRI